MRISALSSLFIVAHDLVDFFDDSGIDLKVFIEQKKSEYDLGHFKKILQVIANSDGAVPI